MNKKAKYMEPGQVRIKAELHAVLKTHAVGNLQCSLAILIGYQLY